MTLKKLLFGIWLQIKRRLALIVVFFVVLVLGYLMWFQPKPKTYNEALKRTYQEVFDVRKVPAGLIIWVHGVPGTEQEFKNAPESQRYEYFDIGILSKQNKVYKVRIPFYVAGMFPLGGRINMNQNGQNHQNRGIPKNYLKNI